jgi:RND family efflux transporter MFP subunit
MVVDAGESALLESFPAPPTRRYGGAVGLLMALWLLPGCGGQTPPSAPPPQQVDALLLQISDPGSRRQFEGEVLADRQAELAFQVSGRLVELAAREGEQVEAGARLARIDPREFENARRSRQAAYDEARSQFERVDRTLAAGAVTQADHDQVRTRYEVAAAELALADKHLADTELRAPFSGRVARRLVDAFQTVRAGQPLLVLENVDRLQVRIGLPEQDMVRLPADVSMLGSPVGEVEFESLPGRRFPVTLHSVQTRADPRTGTWPVAFTLARPEEVAILPGMNARFFPGYEVVVPVQRNFMLPLEALQATPDRRSYVWVIDSDEAVVRRRPVRIGRLSQGGIEIIDGLQPGERVVTSGVVHLVEGMAVRVGE